MKRREIQLQTPARPSGAAAVRRPLAKRLSGLAEEEILAMRICDMGLTMEESNLSRFVERLYQELAHRELKSFRPQVYLGDEWFSPEGVPAIAVPFYLAHPRLRRIEERMMRTLEGGTPDWFMRLLRHEAGHCIDHAYHLSATSSWRKVFGPTERPYRPDRYRFDPQSSDFVVNLENGYAQAHPDEDFAETFAVWLNPEEDWRERYGGWDGALAKLHYVDRTMKSIAQQVPKVTGGPLLCHALRLRSTLGRYYERRARQREHVAPW